MANPRKFSEKIALLNQKEAEGNAEFERIMREVSEVSAKVVELMSNWLRACDDDDENKCEVPIGTEKRREEKKYYSHLRSRICVVVKKKRQFDICAFSYETLIIFFLLAAASRIKRNQRVARFLKVRVENLKSIWSKVQQLWMLCNWSAAAKNTNNFRWFQASSGKALLVDETIADSYREWKPMMQCERRASSWAPKRAKRFLINIAE